MAIGIIGGAGFLGSYLAKVLRSKGIDHHIFDISSDDSRLNQTKFDIETCGMHTNLHGIDTIINLAAVHRDDIKPLSKYSDVNVLGAKNICLAATKNNINTIIFTSSVAIYGFASPNTGEDGKPNYFNEYGKTKYLAEKVYRDWQAEDPQRRSLVIVRPTVIFGPGNRGNVYNLLSQIASKRFAMFGNGKNIKSMAYVENVAHFLLHTIALSPGVHIYNYVDKPDLSMNELVIIARRTLFNKPKVGFRMPAFLGVLIGKIFDFIAWLTGKPLSISSIRVKKFLATTQFSSAVSELGFVAPFSLSEGLEETLKYEFIEDNKDKQTYYTE